jgi:hypothetical protein
LTYPPELAVKETTDTASSASSLEEYLEFDESFQLSTHKIFVSEYKLFKRSNKANLLIALIQHPVSQMKMMFQEIRYCFDN